LTGTVAPVLVAGFSEIIISSANCIAMTAALAPNLDPNLTQFILIAVGDTGGGLNMTAAQRGHPLPAAAHQREPDQLYSVELNWRQPGFRLGKPGSLFVGATSRRLLARRSTWRPGPTSSLRTWAVHGAPTPLLDALFPLRRSAWKDALRQGVA
jgi:hypothetical protein